MQSSQFSFFMKTSNRGMLEIIVITHLDIDLNVEQKILLEFDNFPTIISIEFEKNNDDLKNFHNCNYKIITDGLICKFEILDKYEQIDDSYQHIPDGIRYGAYIVNNNTITYKKDFWNYPSIQSTKNKPILKDISVRPRILHELKI